ncbi:tetratricopeptide (TPR) repeat protein [Flavobacterium arsenatis]|uniref:Tetratricopeptide (TPR) repeat protein n=1 Tax=Flavobacterium arsenatis TaxID=1484332 RepID=A0ABU1TPQ9_9FLAO|nr:tetratricopeptide repeat protein [Flavobacterium arsenatis]MDR6967960.1 tetratricopeptide (TPR) repeat protein [Flavobacterium arsenatis]
MVGQTLDQCKKTLDSGYVAMDRGNYSVALEYFTKTELIAEKNGYYVELFETKNSMGIIYVNLSEYVEALNHYLDAYTVAIKHLDPTREMVVLNNIAVLYAMERNFAKAKEYYLKAYHIAKQEGNSIKVALYAINLAKTENSVKKYKEGKVYIEEALTILREDKNNQKYVIAAEITFAECLIFEGKLDQAKQKLVELYAKTKNDSDKENKASILFKMAHVYWVEKNYEKSIFYIKLALKDTKELERRLDLYDSLSEAYVEINDFKNAFESKNEVLKIRDSLAKINNAKLYETNKVRFEIQNYKNDLNSQLEKSNLERKIFIAAILIFVVLLFGVYRTYRNRSIKQEQKKIIAEREQKIIALELEKEKNENLLLEKHVKEIENEALLEQETLKNEIEQKNRKLSARALYLSGRNEMIEEIVDSLSGLPEVSQNIKLKTHIKTLKDHLKTDAEWDTFIVHFEEVNQGLLSALKEKHPNLSSNDTRFICYVYMNLSLKEIGTIFNITQEACRKRKERIFRKMEIDKDVSFYEYLSRLA